jgi:ribosomal protein RSM22 (predicted rRNA methylase)
MTESWPSRDTGTRAAGSRSAGSEIAGSGTTGSLAVAVEAGLRGAGMASLAAGVRRLMAAYRSGEVPVAPVLASAHDAAAYAAYRMPATAAATGAAFREVRRALPGWSPRNVLDFGAGTGAASWAVADQLTEPVGLTLLEQSADAVRLGQAIAAESESVSLRTARWQPWRLSRGGDVPTGDLAVAAYVIGELTEEQQAVLVDLMADCAPVMLLVEPGTPAGYRRILAARARLLERGFMIAAPCPHQLSCPLAVAGDWCHFAARVQRSALHRQAKGAELSYEDEKFSYIGAVRPGGQSGTPDWPPGRIVRRPETRKNLVLLNLCCADGQRATVPIGKSKGEVYRRARKSSWGGRWDQPCG